MPKDNQLGEVTLYTWGTHHDGGNGMAHFFDTSLFGGNIGHASVCVTFPADQQGKELIKKYCYQEHQITIPFERVMRSVLDANGKVLQQSVFKVYFSWWPGEKAGFNLKTNVNKDSELERSGVDYGQVSPQLDLEQRTYHGILGSKKVTLSPNTISHLSALTVEQELILHFERRLAETKEKIQAMKAIEKNLSSKSRSLKVESTLLNLLDKYILHWRKFVTNPKVMHQGEIHKIKSEIYLKKEDVETEAQLLSAEINQCKKALEKRQEDKITNEVSTLKSHLEQYSPEKRAVLLKARGSDFSENAWVTYELNETRVAFETAQSLSVFFQLSNFNAQKEKILEILFDKKYPKELNETKNIEAWRNLLPASYKDISKEQMTLEIYNELKSQAVMQKSIMQEKFNALIIEKQLVKSQDPFLQQDYERFLTRGLAPDNQINLPVGGILENEHQKLGLNIEKMLQKMHALTQDGEKFNLTTKNCSATTGAILANGAEKHLKSFFTRKAWGGFGNPQEVYNGALLYQQAITHNEGKKTFWQKLSAFNPLNAFIWLAGKTLSATLDPALSFPVRILSGIALIPASILAGITQTVKAVFTPKKTFNNCTNFIKYAWNNPSTFLKLCTIPVAAMATVAAIPAVLQWSVEKIIVEPLAKTSKERQSIISQSQEQQPPLFNKDSLEKIKSQNPVEAINRLDAALNDNPNKIPVLSFVSQKLVDDYVQSLDKNNPNDVKMIEQYQNIVKQIYLRVNQQTVNTNVEKAPKVIQNGAQSPTLNAFTNYKNHQREKDRIQPDFPLIPPSPKESRHSKRF